MPPPRQRYRKRRLTHLRRIQILAVLSGLPGLIATLILLLASDYPLRVHFTVLLFAGGLWFATMLALQARLVRPLQTASNMLSALREGDFSLQASHVHDEDPLGQVMLEINLLGEVLRENRRDAIEATRLLEKLVEEIDVAVFTFDPAGRLGLVNRTGASFLGEEREKLGRRHARDLGLEELLAEDAPGGVYHNLFPQRQGRYTVKRGTFREEGQPHTLLLVTDVSQPLRDEERLAWKRLIRVLGHELNNSLTPIRSLSASLQKIISREPLAEDWQEDVKDGLHVISTRADSLSRFMQEYSRLAKLPPPQRRAVDLGELVERVAGLSTSLSIEIIPGPPITLQADPDQLEQLLINLSKNAVEAALETGGAVRIGWKEPWQTASDRRVTLTIEDEGLGVANPDNLFIPFFSTKKDGSGIGLTLSRQIAEAHDGTLDLANRPNGQPGAIATLILPCLVDGKSQ